MDGYQVGALGSHQTNQIIIWYYRGWKLLLRHPVSIRIYSHAGIGKSFYGFYERFIADGYRFCPLDMSNRNRLGESRIDPLSMGYPETFKIVESGQVAQLIVINENASRVF